MVKRKRLGKSILALLMALCLLAGTVQTSTVVYAAETGESASMAEEETPVDYEEKNEGESDEEDPGESEEDDEEDATAKEPAEAGESAEDPAEEELTEAEAAKEEPAEAEQVEDTSEEELTKTEEVQGAQGLDEQTKEAAETQENESKIGIGQYALARVAGFAIIAENNDNTSKTLTVGSGGDYTVIQEAINYIYGLTNGDGAEDGWTINVEAGTYARFVVQPGVDNLTIIGAGDATVIETLCDDGITVGKTDACGIYKADKVSFDTQGIIVDYASDFTLKNVKITMGTNSTSWKSSAIALTNGDTTMEADNGFTLDSCSIEGAGASEYSTGGMGVFVDNKCDEFTIENCTFTGCLQAIYYENTHSGPESVTIKDNTFTDCSFAFHGSWSSVPVSGETGSFTMSGNTVTGSESLRNKIVIQDTNDLNAVKVVISGNTLNCGLIGTINLQAESEINNVLGNNNFGTSSFYVDAVEPGSIDVTYTSYQAPDNGSAGYWAVTGIDDLEVSWGKNPEGTLEAVQAAVNAANASGSKTLNITGLDSTGDGSVDTLIKTFTWFKDAIYFVSKETGSLTVDKTIVYGDSSKDFTFVVQIDASKVDELENLVLTGAYGTKINADGTTETVELSDGAATLTLSDGESVTFNNLPVGATYTVTEASAAKYTATIETTDDNAGIDGASVTGTVLSSETTVSYTNTYGNSGSDADWSKSKSKEATQLELQENGTLTSEVTLSLPSAEEELVTDVVFVLDKSTSTDVVTEIMDMLSELEEQVAGTNASVKVGIVIFNKEARVATDGLVDLEEYYSDIVKAVQSGQGSGTNLHAGLLAGKALLDEDTEVDANRKYLIVVSDGITYMYDQEGTATVPVYYWINDGSHYYSVDPYAWKFEYGSESYIPSSWETWLLEVGTILESETTPESAYDDAKEYLKLYKTTGECVEGEVNADNLDSSEYTTNIDRALYYCYQVYTAAQTEGYNCYIVDKGTTTSNSWGPSFMEYLAGGDIYQVSDIEREVLYLLGAGSTVVDVIGYGTYEDGEEYNFDFANSANYLHLYVGNIEYTTAVSTAVLDENETSRYIFTSDNVTADINAEAPFVLHYYENGTDGASDECFIWDININVSNFERVQLTYTVVLDGRDEAGTYGTYDRYGDYGYEGLQTNIEATLYPVDSDGNESAPEEFQKPTVSYEVINVTTPEAENPGDPADTETAEYPGEPVDTETTETVVEDPTDPQEAESTVAAEVVSAVTGDNAPIGIAILIAAISEITLITLIILQMRKKKREIV